MLTGSLELASKQIVSGAVRIGFAVIYSLFLVSWRAFTLGGFFSTYEIV